MIGIVEDTKYKAAFDVVPGSELVVFSDGVFETARAEDGVFGSVEDWVAYVRDHSRNDSSFVDRADEHTQALGGSSLLADDFSLLHLRF